MSEEGSWRPAGRRPAGQLVGCQAVKGRLFRICLAAWEMDNYLSDPWSGDKYMYTCTCAGSRPITALYMYVYM